MGFDWGEHLYFASDYFERMFEVAEGLIRAGKAYVDSSSEEEIREKSWAIEEVIQLTGNRQVTHVQVFFQVDDRPAVSIQQVFALAAPQVVHHPDRVPFVHQPPGQV